MTNFSFDQFKIKLIASITEIRPCRNIGQSNVTESVVTIRSPFLGITWHKCAELSEEDLSCYLNNIQYVGL